LFVIRTMAGTEGTKQSKTSGKASGSKAGSKAAGSKASSKVRSKAGGKAGGKAGSKAAGSKAAGKASTNKVSSKASGKAPGVAARSKAAVSKAASKGKLPAQGKTGKHEAVALMTGQHHDALSQLAKALKATDAESRRMLLERLCNSVVCHMRIEEEIFYPLMVSLEPFDAKDKKKQENEHDDVKKMMKQLLSTKDVLNDKVTQTLKMMEKDLKEHMATEENEIFPKIKSLLSDSERAALGEKLHKRFTELQAKQDPQGLVEKDLK
jgi:hemerythrin-like domain-containing protein